LPIALETVHIAGVDVPLVSTELSNEDVSVLNGCDQGGYVVWYVVVAPAFVGASFDSKAPGVSVGIVPRTGVGYLVRERRTLAGTVRVELAGAVVDSTVNVVEPREVGAVVEVLAVERILSSRLAKEYDSLQMRCTTSRTDFVLPGSEANVRITGEVGLEAAGVIERELETGRLSGTLRCHYIATV